MPTSSRGFLSDDSLFQNSVYIGINIENILYGVELVLYFKTVQILATRVRYTRKKSALFYAIFSSIMLFSVTVWIATQALFGEEMWLLQSHYPGGPDAYWEKNISIWYMDLATTLLIIQQLMTDGLMIYRCRVIWNNDRVIVIPVILWLVTLVLGIFVDWTSSVPGGDFYTGASSKFVLWYYTVSVVLNATLTFMICFYIIRHAKRVEKRLGREYSSAYFTAVAIIVESLAPATLSGIAFLVSLGVGSSTSVAFICVYILMMCIAPQLLILRVLMGRAWDGDTGKASTLEFSPGHKPMPKSTNYSADVTHTELQTLSNVYVPDERRDGKTSITGPWWSANHHNLP